VVENENLKVNTDSLEDSVSLINNDTHIIIYIIILHYASRHQMLRSPRGEMYVVLYCLVSW